MSPLNSSDQVLYEGIAYRQSQNPGAPWLISFVAPAEQLRSWSGIPRRTDQTLSGFQRSDDPVRVAKAKEFFDLGINQSPTSLIVGIHPVPPGGVKRVGLEFLDGVDTDPVRKCRLTVYAPEHIDLELAVELVKDQVKSRLGAIQPFPAQTETEMESETFSAGDPEEESTSDDFPTATEASEPAIESDADGEHGLEPLEMGRSLLVQLLQRLEDSDWCESNKKDILDMAKPATVIDGQHRIMAAEQCERNIPFSVCAIYDCNWPEQVFQFTVVNYTARGIPDQFITANAALSLTKSELGDLQDRLVQAGVKVTEYELMRTVQFDSESPFYELVNLGEKANPEKIGYRSMVRLAKTWYQGRHPAISQLLQGLYPDLIGSKASKKRIDRWQEVGWGMFFKDFWRTALKVYGEVKTDDQGHTLWSPGHSNLLTGVVLQELQEAFLDHLAQQDVDTFFTANDKGNAVFELRPRVEKRADIFFSWIPAEFFSAHWELKSLSVGPGREALKQVMGNFVRTKGKYQYAKSAFFTGQIG